MAEEIGISTTDRTMADVTPLLLDILQSSEQISTLRFDLDIPLCHRNQIEAANQTKGKKAPTEQPINGDWRTMGDG